MTSYEIGVLGDFTIDETTRLIGTLTSLLSDFDLVLGVDVMVRTSADFQYRNTHAATVAVYFGGTARKADQDRAQEAVRSSTSHNSYHPKQWRVQFAGARIPCKPSTACAAAPMTQVL